MNMYMKVFVDILDFGCVIYGIGSKEVFIWVLGVVLYGMGVVSEG